MLAYNCPQDISFPLIFMPKNSHKIHKYYNSNDLIWKWNNKFTAINQSAWPELQNAWNKYVFHIFFSHFFPKDKYIKLSTQKLRTQVVPNFIFKFYFFLLENGASAACFHRNKNTIMQNKHFLNYLQLLPTHSHTLLLSQMSILLQKYIKTR